MSALTVRAGRRRTQPEPEPQAVRRRLDLSARSRCSPGIIHGLAALAVVLAGFPDRLPGRLAGALHAQDPPSSAAADPGAALETASGLYRGVLAVCADFEQVIEVSLLGRTVESAGRICQQRPNLFSMRFTDPMGDLVVSDGEHVWVHYPSVDPLQVMRHPVSVAPGRGDFFREFLDDPRARYELADGGQGAVRGRPCRIVVLDPLPGAAYRRARLWLDREDHMIRRVEIRERSGNLRTVTLARIELGIEPEPSLFAFAVPEGARVTTPGGRR